ncbi:CPBP family intramembrane metalloprotease [Sediminibacterium roseum]|uniref:CPBP family intramembrane metalloprotease n=1 Tax=Sediminibacterium roseum TaxID=1978412 RepID=A0ABW9ZN11_9BACT|nr:CPBP family intramembrane glutamic endopeptidase [Sediminibacterium roseum]NCI48464.1 CPBP family intramembrane metalloprotease [Sediminibacterium roseum]
MNQKPVINYPSQLALLLGLIGVFMVICGLLIGVAGSAVMHVKVADFGKAILLPENANLSRLLNTVTSFIVFGLPAFFLAKVLSRRPFSQLGFTTALNLKQVVVALVLLMMSIFLGDALAQLNQRIPIPGDWRVWANKLESDYRASMMSMATMKTFGDYLLGLLVLAFFPALFEEVLFRGGLQQVMVGWTQNKWFGITITSILFSAIHFSYFGFLPRMALGMILGFTFYYSKNIWLSILIHFANNALVVTTLYVLARQGKPIAENEETVPLWFGLIALPLIFLVFRFFKKESGRVLVRHAQHVHSSPENIVS